MLFKGTDTTAIAATMTLLFSRESRLPEEGSGGS